MNIFYTDNCPVKAANNLCTIHQNKMYQESCQLLATALQLSGVVDSGLCKPTHQNHPVAVWLRSSVHHYHWLVEHTKALRDAYAKPEHGYDKYLEAILQHTPNLPDTVFIDPPKCVDDDIRKKSLFKPVTECYKEYLKKKYVDWTTRTDKKQMSVKFVSVVPDYLKDVF